jgi:hypothetical protein
MCCLIISHDLSRESGEDHGLLPEEYSQYNALFQNGEVPEREESLIILKYSLNSVQFSRTAYDLTQEMSFNIKYVTYFFLQLLFETFLASTDVSRVTLENGTENA